MTTTHSERGRTWFARLTRNAPLAHGYPDSVLVADAEANGQPARFIAVVPDPHNRFARVRDGEVGLVEGWQIARAVRELVEAEAERGPERKSAIVAVVDVTSQAYGRKEEAFGIHQALAAAAAAYADARLAGHPVIALLVGKAISGAFLAHGYQANRIIALDDPGVSVHAMSKASAARITLRSVEALDSLAAQVPPMAYDIQSYASLGLLWCLLPVSDADAPSADDLDQVEQALQAALEDIRAAPDRGLAGRLAAENRSASRKVRERMRAQWQTPLSNS